MNPLFTALLILMTSSIGFANCADSANPSRCKNISDFGTLGTVSAGTGLVGAGLAERASTQNIEWTAGNDNRLRNGQIRRRARQIVPNEVATVTVSQPNYNRQSIEREISGLKADRAYYAKMVEEAEANMTKFRVTVTMPQKTIDGVTYWIIDGYEYSKQSADKMHASHNKRWNDFQMEVWQIDNKIKDLEEELQRTNTKTFKSTDRKAFKEYVADQQRNKTVNVKYKGRVRPAGSRAALIGGAALMAVGAANMATDQKLAETIDNAIEYREVEVAE